MLHIYKDTNPLSKVGPSNPLYSTHDALRGTHHIQKLYVRNDDSNVYYEDIVLRFHIEDVDAGNVSELGIVYQLYKSDTEPSLSQWTSVDHHNELNWESLGEEGDPDTSSYLPFYMRIYVPGNSSIQTVEEASLNILAIEQPV